MHRLLTTFILLCSAAAVLAQGQGLEGDFSKLSAKERSRIAKAEEEGASKDAQYQAVMARAEEHFREQRFDEALVEFTAARDLRPYNVYPRVKIQDLQALIAKRDAALAGTPDPSDGPAKVQEPKVESPPATRGPKPVEPERHTPEQQRSRPAERSTPPLREPLTPVAPIAEGERVYKEGRAVVVERTTQVEGRMVVFRKVSHPWGEVVYFKDGTAIPERVWAEVFEAR